MPSIPSVLLSLLLIAGNLLAQSIPKTSEELRVSRIASAKASVEKALVALKPVANSLARQEDKARVADEMLPLLKNADTDMVYWGHGQPAHPAQITIQLAIKQIPSSTNRYANKKWTWDTLKTRTTLEKALKELDPAKAQPK